MRPVTILIVDANQDMRTSLRMAFESENWTVLEACNRVTMVDALKGHGVDLIIIDPAFDDDPDLHIAQDLRTIWNIPILIISEKSSAQDRIAGLECGADDYIVKPFHIKEVVLRTRKTLELHHREICDQSDLVFDHTIFEVKRGVVKHMDGSTVELTGLERKLLTLFAQHPGRILTIDEISQTLHGRDWSPDDRTIDGHVARLRRKIAPAAAGSATLIRSVRGIGYAFTSDVRVARS